MTLNQRIRDNFVKFLVYAISPFNLWSNSNFGSLNAVIPFSIWNIKWQTTLRKAIFLSRRTCFLIAYFLAGFMLIINHVTMFGKIKNFKNIQEVNMCNINFYPFTSPLIFLSKITLLLHLLNSCRVWDWTQALTHLST